MSRLGGRVVRTGEVIYWFPAEPTTQHQVNVRMRKRREIRLRHFYGTATALSFEWAGGVVGKLRQLT